MDDSISRQAAIDRINKQREHLKPDIDERDAIGDAAYRVCAEFIERLPSAQPERKTGKWIHTDTQAGYDINGDLVWADMMKCETCGFEICAIQGHIAQYNFCPNCGADMRGEGHE